MDEPVASPEPALGELRARATSDDGLISAVVDGSGRLLELSFEPSALRKQPSDLGALTVATVNAAQDAGRDQARAYLAELVPTLPAHDELTATLQQLHATATDKLAEMTATLQQLIDRADGGTR